jgi:putative ABC transport system permease protein
MNHFFDTLSEIFHYLRQYKARTFMTMFGIIWGTISIIVLMAFGVGVQHSMSRNMHGMGEGIAIMWPGRTSMAFAGFNVGRTIPFREEDVALLRQEIPELESVCPEYSTWNVPVRVSDKVNKPNISGVIPEYGVIRNIWPEAGGRWINELDLKERKRVIFLGNTLKTFLFGEETDAVGKYVLVGDNPFLVIGVLVKKIQQSSYSARDEDRSFIPASTFHSLFGNRYLNNIVYKAKDPTQSEYLRTRIYEVMGQRNKFNPVDKQALNIWDTTEMDKFVYYFSLGLKIFLALIGIMTLTVGGIGLANIMYVVVQERTYEIGIRRSIGAKRHHIMGQFILETFIIMAISSLIGFSISLVIIKGLAAIPQLDEYVGTPVVDLSVALATALVLSGIGFIAGYFPARKAARLHVIDCLRFSS